MAEKRIFTKKITSSDAFVTMPLSAQALYFHLNLEADDDGFVNNTRSIMRNIQSSEEDFQILIHKNFIIYFESEVVVIKHWWVHNIKRKDRYHETTYFEEMQCLELKDNGVYTLKNDSWQPNGNQVSTKWQPSVPESKVNESKVSKSNKILSGLEKPDAILFGEIIDYLNLKTGKKFRASTEKTKRHIRARWNEGFRLDDFKTVIDAQTDKWKGDKKMETYLRPETLFGTKFESYLNGKGEVKDGKIKKSSADYGVTILG